jgi:hypothetical protein
MVGSVNNPFHLSVLVDPGFFGCNRVTTVNKDLQFIKPFGHQQIPAPEAGPNGRIIGTCLDNRHRSDIQKNCQKNCGKGGKE